MRIFGVDPGSVVAGFGCLETTVDPAYLPKHFRVVAAGALKFKPKLAHSTRIGELFVCLEKLIREYRPDVIVVERAFGGVNMNSALKLGEARGAAIAAAHSQKVDVVHVTPAEVKKLVAGNGRADKEMVSAGVRQLLGFSEDCPYDVTDALAVALTFGMSALMSTGAPGGLGTVAAGSASRV